MNLSVSRVGFAMPMQAQNVQFKGAEKVAKVVTDVVKAVVKSLRERSIFNHRK